MTCIKPFFIGIAGGSASGKSTFCSALEARLSKTQVCSFHMDDYFRPEAERPFITAPDGEREYVDDNHPDTVDLERFRLDVREALAGDADIVLAEGLLTLWDKELASLLSLKLYVDCRADERAIRRVKRNMGWGQSFEQITDVYLDAVRYRHDEFVEPTKWNADLILNGAYPSPIALDSVTALIQSKTGLAIV